MHSNMIVSSFLLSIGAASAFPRALPQLVARQDFGSCRNQSCEVATVAGSTGRTNYPFPTYPSNDTQDGDCCIIRYFPAVKAQIYAHRPGLQQYCASHGGDSPKDKNPPGVDYVTVSSKRQVEAEAELLPRQIITPSDCKPNILIFIKGTSEPGTLGVTVGPALQKKLDKNLWNVVGVNYDNSFANDYCLGLPGNIPVRNALLNYVNACPKSQIAMGGYSQGAMVIRNAIARAASKAVARVTNVVTFGDPFIGAPIGQYSGPVHVFCMAKDGVCNGQLDISPTHLSYANSADVDQAVQILQATQKTS